jgi:hypothetical protein
VDEQIVDAEIVNKQRWENQRSPVLYIG